jgi:ComF family protein
VLHTLSLLGRETARIVLHAACVVCDRELPWRERTASCCADCWSSMPAIASSKCSSCALPIPEGDRCIDCMRDPLPVGWTEAWGYYRGALEQVLHAFKFERHDFLATPLAGLIETTLRARDDVSFDVVVPVPMHRSKLRRRGYNQAELLARAVARRLRTRCERSLLIKKGDTPAQSKLARVARAANVRHAFAATPRAEGLSILLVDDVSTTGETIRACAKELLRAGAARVCAAVVAKTV